MELDLERKEADLLSRILSEYLSDLRMEIADTDKYEMREALKQDEVLIKRLIARLESKDTLAA